ncbi:MAG: hypothetical protein LBS74_00090 [Oscillospiraceae bacterium]|jgi:hypothetical protein|nr:hypothetical protein [Oscillospiraceae bacterium]
MCLLLTILAAVISGALWRLGSKSLGTLALIYTGAAVMWLVDCFFALAEGEPFLNISLDDSLLGVLVIACGAVLWLALCAFKKLRVKKST